MRATMAATMAALAVLVGAAAANGPYAVGVYGYAYPGMDLIHGYSVFDGRYGLGTRYGYSERFGFGTRYGYGDRYGNDSPDASRFGAGTRYGHGDRFGYIPSDYDQRTTPLAADVAPAPTPGAARSYDRYSNWRPRYGAGPTTMPRAASTQTSAPARR